MRLNPVKLYCETSHHSKSDLFNLFTYTFTLSNPPRLPRPKHRGPPLPHQTPPHAPARSCTSTSIKHELKLARAGKMACKKTHKGRSKSDGPVNCRTKVKMEQEWSFNSRVEFKVLVAWLLWFRSQSKYNCISTIITTVSSGPGIFHIGMQDLAKGPNDLFFVWNRFEFSRSKF